MRAFRWTKQQDFNLRLGLLKVLVAVLRTGRFGVPRDQIIKRLSDALFVPAPPPLLEAAEEALGARVTKGISRSEALLIVSGSPSWGQPIKEDTAYKILDWGQNTGFVGRGYRISERGQLLFSMMDSVAVEAFLTGDPFAWNPYSFTIPERAYLLYHLGESDELMWQLAFDLGALDTGSEITAHAAYKFTLAGMQDVLRRAQPAIPIPELPRFRTARELAETIEWELSPGDSPPRRSRPLVPTPRIPGKPSSGSKRKSKKNADHQAIPRFEQLIDLGFLTKHVDPALKGAELDRARKAWSFNTTNAAKSFRLVLGGAERLEDPNWYWSHFAGAFAAGLGGEHPARPATTLEAIDLFVEAYDIIHRPVGQTPFESVAILAMALGLGRGLAVEIRNLHEIVLRLKREGALQDQIFFAAGNEVDRMFILVRPKFRDAFAAWMKERP